MHVTNRDTEVDIPFSINDNSLSKNTPKTPLLESINNSEASEELCQLLFSSVIKSPFSLKEKTFLND